MQPDAAPRFITVFGGSQVAPDSPLYRQARELGRRLAEAGFGVISGGYGGTMEAVSRGAREAGGEAIGITLATFDRAALRPNAYLTAEHKAPNYLDRLAELTHRASGFIALRGGIGTLSEVSITLSLLQIGELPPRPVVLLGECWSAYLDTVRREFMLRPEDLAPVYVAADAAQAVVWLQRALQ
ncbi:MAG: LOG family protein [Anaerolineae bacterium]|nr:LOG family protein [Anaerolineae bacterium]